MCILALGLGEAACVAPAGEIGELMGSTGAGTGEEPETTTGTESADTGGSSTGEPPSACGPDGPSCAEDPDGDCVGIGDDNAPGVPNPDQSDIDGDGLGDPIDACPSVVSTGDSDVDGLGNECDPCRRPSADYNLPGAGAPGYMRVRNIPSVADADGDGIGDACDNCVLVPNCEAYGPGMPWRPGDPIAYADEGLCQGDADDDMVGDACEGLAPLPGAAGVVGLGPDDDFDQDGLSNVVDACPRSPLGDAIPCGSDIDCPDSRHCEIAFGLCDHLDSDLDGVGNVCDTCAATEDPLQVADPPLGDEDGDFIGVACESTVECDLHSNPSRVGFYPVSVGGWCCTQQYPGDGELLDPDGVAITLDCAPADEVAGICRKVPLAVELTPGFVSMYPGCDQALVEAGLTVETHVPLTPEDVGGIEGLWEHSCRLPPFDQDFDGLADACDLCPLAFDPENLPYIDAGGMLWPSDGKYCNGVYAVTETCGG